MRTGSALSKANRKDLTEGCVWKKLILFALPLLGSSLIQQLYNAVDLFVVGNFVEYTGAMSSIGASSRIITLLVGFFTGMSVGSGVVVSLFFGEKNHKKLGEAVHTAMTMGAIGGLALMVLGYVISPTILTWMNTPDDIFDMAVSYIRIYFFSVPALVLYNMGTGILRATGDSRRPLIYQTIGGVLNIILDTILVVCFHLGVEGVAYATLVTQSVPAALVVLHLMRTKEPYRLRLRCLGIRKDIMVRIIRIGLPAGIQSMVITLSNIVVQSYINGFGSTAIAAFTAYFEIEMVLYLPIVAFGQAVTTFTGQNVGAGSYDRVQKGIRWTLLLGIGVTAAIATPTTIFASQVFGILCKDSAVIECGVQIFTITAPLYFIYNFLEVFSGALRGHGCSLMPTIIIVGNMCFVRIALLAVFVSLWGSIASVAVCYPITWVLTSLCLMVCYYKSGLYKKIKAFRRTKTHPMAESPLPGEQEPFMA